MSDKEKIVTINGIKYVQRTSIGWCDEPFKFLEELSKKSKDKRSGDKKK